MSKITVQNQNDALYYTRIKCMIHLRICNNSENTLKRRKKMGPVKIYAQIYLQAPAE